MNKKIILIDMDNTIADFEKSFREEAKRNGWEIDEEKTKKEMEIFLKNDNGRAKAKSIFRKEGFYLNLESIENSIEVIKELNSKYEIFFCSSPLSKYENCVLEKYKWIEKKFGREFTKKIILTKDKTLVEGDFLIDDKPKIFGVNNPKWEHILFSREYNKNIKDKRRIDLWKDAVVFFDNFK